MTVTAPVAAAGIAALPGTGVPARAIGEILVARGALSDGALALALTEQALLDCRLGELLCARGWTREHDVAAALAEQWGIAFVDLASAPTEARAAPAAVDPGPCIAHRMVPWRTDPDGRQIFATDDPLRALASPLVWSAQDLVVVTRADLDTALGAAFGPALAERAALRTEATDSVRSLGGLRASLGAGMALALVAALALDGGAAAIALLGAAVLLVMGALTSGLRLAALIAGRMADARPGAAEVALARWPRLSILVPLYREAGMVGKIVSALEACDYPRELLDVKILIEEADGPTRDALAGARLPAWIEVLVVPEGRPRTKPRALNFALDFCRGDIIGVLDAEDRPDPQQFRSVARHLLTAPGDVACVQCQLSYFNARENWITRCFQIEYSIWFDVLLRGYQRLGLPVPLGGTSVYFRRAALADVGGWDAHNVTEDADLGMRLARRGLRVDVVSATTEEEASCRPLVWIRQRSRWLKGYILTWLCHMRRPGRLYAELGLKGFVGLNVLLLGGALSYLAMPLFWIAVALRLTTGQGIWAGAVPDWLLWPLAATLAAGQIVMLACAALALRRRRSPGLLAWVPILPVYWTLGALAAWKAVLELFVAPYYWDKTRHGLTRWAAMPQNETVRSEAGQVRRPTSGL